MKLKSDYYCNECTLCTYIRLWSLSSVKTTSSYHDSLYELTLNNFVDFFRDWRLLASNQVIEGTKFIFVHKETTEHEHRNNKVYLSHISETLEREEGISNTYQKSEWPLISYQYQRPISVLCCDVADLVNDDVCYLVQHSPQLH